MKKTKVIVAVVALTLALAGCAQSTQSEPSKEFEAQQQEQAPTSEAPAAEIQDLAVVESGFSNLEDDVYGQYVSFGVVVENPNTDYGFVNPSIKVSIKDADGKILKVQDYHPNQLLPEEVYGFGDSLAVEGVASSVDVIAVNGESQSVGAEYSEFKPVKVTQVNQENDSFRTEFYVSLSNENGKQYDHGTVGIIGRDANGLITFGSSGSVYPILEGTTDASISVATGSLPEAATLEAYGHID